MNVLEPFTMSYRSRVRKAKVSTNPTDDEVNKGLRDRSARVRLAWAERTDFTPTMSQVLRGLSDNYHIAKVWAGNYGYTMTSTIFNEIVRKDCANLRRIALSRLDYIPNSAEVDILLDDRAAMVLTALASRTDIMFTSEQLERGLRNAASDPVLKRLWLNRTKDYLRVLLNSEDEQMDFIL